MRSLSFLLLVALPCLAADGEWQTVVSGPITVKNRTLEGTGLKEVWAEGELAAPALDVQAALMEVSRLRFFMPYMKDARELGERLPDGSVYVYTLVDLPVLGKRDYVVRLELKESLGPDGSGTFRNEWHAFPDFTPRRHDIIRLTRDDGSWVVTPRGQGKSWAVYRFVVDPGGWVPTFAANLGNERGVKETWDAVEKEALRRRDARLASPHPDPLPLGQRESVPARPDQPR